MQHNSLRDEATTETARKTAHCYLQSYNVLRLASMFSVVGVSGRSQRVGMMPAKSSLPSVMAHRSKIASCSGRLDDDNSSNDKKNWLLQPEI